MADNSVQISPIQRRVHVVAEAFALLAVVPFMLYVATRERKLTSGEKGLLATAAIGTLVVDGWLLHRFGRDRRG